MPRRQCMVLFFLEGPEMKPANCSVPLPLSGIDALTQLRPQEEDVEGFCPPLSFFQLAEKLKIRLLFVYESHREN